MAKVPNLSFVKEAREELSKVSWPSRETTIRYTIIVIVMSIAMGVITGLMDYLLSHVFQYFIFS